MWKPPSNNWQKVYFHSIASIIKYKNTATIAAQGVVMLMDLEQALQINQEALRKNEQRLSAILDSLEDAVWSAAPDYSRWFYLNSSAQRVFGHSVAEFIGNINLLQEIVHPEDRELVEKAYKTLLLEERQDIEYRIVWPNGEIHWIHARTRLIRDERGNPLSINGMAAEITERKRIQVQLEFDALHDGLTGLANRNLLMDRIGRAIARSQRHTDTHFAVLFLDLDHFKVVNDGLGHLIGDRFLIQIARRLQQFQRQEDTIARVGGDEFVILIEDLERPEEAVAIAERLQQALKRPFVLEGKEIFITACIGITIGGADTHYQQAADLLRDADTALYRAKARGQGHSQVFNPEMHAQALRRLQVESDLRRAIERQELRVHYQPIICLTNGQLKGIEALVRWQHPVRGLISPGEFVPIAEETGLILAIDYWVMQSACYQLRDWQEQYPELDQLSVSVNLSANHFSHDGLLEFLDRVFAETGLSANSLKLEVTESAVIKNPEAARKLLEALRERGVQVCLDDFGTGYSSLSYLQCFPFNVLKIDRSFINQLTANVGNQEILKAIINLGLTLNMKVVAEGVETPEQLVKLKNFNCPYAQGYWFSKPINSEEMAALLPSLVSRQLSWRSNR
jgi:diguanylate cyclase (GGDEF)-like protein/PAS domain S-box-containing protein